MKRIAICLYCGREFETTKHRASKRIEAIFCEPECARTYKINKAREERESRRPIDPITEFPL